MMIKLLLWLSSSLSYTFSIITSILTPLFHADPLHRKGGWQSNYIIEHFNDNDDDNDTNNVLKFVIAAVIVMDIDHNNTNDDDNDADEFIERYWKVSLVLLLLSLSLSSSLSYTCSKIPPILTPLFHADPLHPRGG